MYYVVDRPVTESDEYAASYPLTPDIDLEKEFEAWKPQNNALQIPTPVAKAEFIAKISLRLPWHSQVRQLGGRFWHMDEQMYRADNARMIRVFDFLLEKSRQDSTAEKWPEAEILLAYAKFMAKIDLVKSESMARDALAIFRNYPGKIDEEIHTLLHLSELRLLAGDHAGNQALLESAVKTRDIHPVHKITSDWLDLRIAQTLFDDGNIDAAIKLAEPIVRGMMEGEKKSPAQVRVRAAQQLAEFYGAAGRLDDVKIIYERHVFPWANTTSVVGNDMTAAAHLGMLQIEALMAPSEKTVADLKQRLLSMDIFSGIAPDRRRVALRAMAIAFQGLGQSSEALNAARETFRVTPKIETGKHSGKADTRLFETLIGAAWGVANESGTTQANMPQ